ncbi:MAG: hypothetical protein IJB93_02200, partial [Clostridia bacterium]|nr:hypothetical protein [Clostridia bacterium]
MKKARTFLCAVLVVVMCLMSASLSGFDFKAEAADYQVGDIIQFGSYPQSEVKDEALIEKLNELAPEWDDWTSYGYYSGNNDFFGSMVQGDWMRYTDVNYNGKKYRGVKFTQYRPLATYAYGSAENSCQDLMGYYTNTIYWFEFEEVSWLIIDPDTGFVVSNFVIDAQPFSNTVYKKSDSNDGNVYNTLTFS